MELVETIVNFIESINFEVILEYLNYINCYFKSISQNLIGYQVTLIAITFALLPFVIDKNDEIYLGYTISDWILFERNKNKFLNSSFHNLFKSSKVISDVAVNFIMNMVFIIINLILFHFKQYAIVVILFVIFVIYFTYKVVNYLHSVSSNLCDKEIEKEFLLKVENDIPYISDRLNYNYNDKVNQNRKTLNFILKHYHLKNMPRVYDYFVNMLLSKLDNNQNYMVYEELSNYLSSRVDSTPIYINLSYENIRYFWVYIVNDNNSKNISEIFYPIFTNAIDFSNTDIKSYSYILVVTYNSINQNNNLSVDNKEMLKGQIINRFRLIDYVPKDQKMTENEKLNKFKHLYYLFKNAIDEKDEFGISGCLELVLEHAKHYFGVHDIKKGNSIQINTTIIIMSYLYYLIEFEVPPYVSEKEKDNLLSIKEKIKESLTNSSIEYIKNFNIDEICEYIDLISTDWERFIMKKFSTTIKTVRSYNAIKTVKQTLLIIFKRFYNKDVSEFDLKIFANETKDNSLNDEKIEKIINCSEFFGLAVNEDEIKTFIENCVKYAKENKLYNINNTKITDFKHELITSQKKLKEKVKNIAIINKNRKVDGKKYSFNKVLYGEERYLYLQLTGKYSAFDISEFVERNILEVIFEKNPHKISFENTETERLYNDYSDYYYLVSDYDKLEFSKNSNTQYLEFKGLLKNVIKLKTQDKRILLNKFQCRLIGISVKLVPLNEYEIYAKLDGKRENDLYLAKGKYGFDIECNKQEFIEYALKKYKKIEVNINIEMNISDESYIID